MTDNEETRSRNEILQDNAKLRADNSVLLIQLAQAMQFIDNCGRAIEVTGQLDGNPLLKSVDGQAAGQAVEVDDELKWSLQAARSNVEVIDVDDYRDLLNRGQYALCILIYALSRTDKLTPELQSEVDDIVSSYDEKKREWLKYR